MNLLGAGTLRLPHSWFLASAGRRVALQLHVIDGMGFISGMFIPVRSLLITGVELLCHDCLTVLMGQTGAVIGAAGWLLGEGISGDQDAA